MTEFSSEREKWDQIYSSQELGQEDETLRAFNLEFAANVLQLLPDGGKTIEVGSGGGWQSLALARTGKFETSLLDFSNEALNYSKKVFQRENLISQYILQDAFSFGTPDYDLVFNAGVLEHYTVGQQVNLLKAMASRSRKYVLALVPNATSYWYWIWRNYYSANNTWPFGKEIPLTDLSEVFVSAGLNFIGHKYMGSDWTENFFTNISGIDEELRQQILEIHRSKAIPSSQTGYLLCGLGVIPGGEAEAVSGWQEKPPADNRTVAELTSSINELTAINLQSHRQAAEQIIQERKLSEEKINHERKLSEEKILQERKISEETINRLHEELAHESEKETGLSQHLQGYQQTIDELKQEMERRVVEADAYKQEMEGYSNRIEELNQVVEAKEILIDQMKASIDESNLKIIELQQTNSGTQQVLQQIQSSRAWRLVRFMWKVRVAVAPQGSRRAKTLSKVFRLAQKQKLAIQSIQSPMLNASPSVPDHLEKFIVSPSAARVLLITRVFFDPSGNNMQFGGAERYLLELSRIIRSIGYEPVIVQCGNEHWLRYYLDVPVVGVKVGEAYDQFIPELEKLSPSAALVIYSPFELFSEKIKIPAIGISHGVYWDDANYQGSRENLLSTIDHFKSIVSQLDTLISVDTNTLNWLRTVDLSTAQKGEYIPNFVDLEQFSVNLSQKAEREKITILFPRRLVKQRGFWLLHDILPALLTQYPQTDFHFVGKAAPQEQLAINNLASLYPDQVHWYFLPPEEMHRVYEKADITLIPTIQSEGTSLSCLEAMAAGNAVIASNVGGLTDLIIHGHNGILIEPNAQDLHTALERLINDPHLRQKLGQNGQEVAKNFSIQNWQERWKRALVKMLPNTAAPLPSPSPKFVIFPFGYGIFWSGVKQRPHHLAVQFVAEGYQVYWYTPEGRQPDPSKNIHLLGQMDEVYVDRPVLFIYYPQSYLDIGRFINPIVVYDVLDDISIHDTSGTEDTARLARECHEKLLQRADFVIASSRMLVDQIKPRRPDILYVPNAVDIHHFSPGQMPVRSLSEEKPVIGYHGAIATWFDGKLIAEVARLRPQYKFVMVGPLSDEPAESSLRSQPNIQIVGAIPYEELPGYIAGFDVGIMPFKISPLTNAVRPLKILEYFAMKKPVVATPMKEILDWPGVLFADKAEAFAEQIDKALADGFADEDGTIHDFVLSSTWEEVIKPLRDQLNDKYSVNPSTE